MQGQESAARAALGTRPARPGASPGLLRRRYSVPETVMRKYKLAQLKTDTEDSEAGSAPSPRGSSPLRGKVAAGAAAAASGAASGRGPRAALLRRLWGRGAAMGGSHAELRYCERDGPPSPRPRSPCPCLGRSPPAPVSPKRQKLLVHSGGSPERYIARLESARDALRETRPRRAPPASSSVSEGSPKLGLSSLATSSYPANDTTSASELGGDVTESSASFSSADVSRSRAGSDRPLSSTTDPNLLPSPPLLREVGRGLPAHEVSTDSPTVEATSASITDTGASPSRGSESALSPSEKISSPQSAYSESDATFVSTESATKTATETPPESSSQPTTSSSVTTTTTETRSDATPSADRKETTSPGDSAMSTHTHTAETSSDGTKDGYSRWSPPTASPDRDRDPGGTERETRDRTALELSDTGISETVENDLDSNKNSVQSFDEPDRMSSKPGSTTYSEDCSTDFNSDMITCIENSMADRISLTNSNKEKFECLEVVVSETLSSSAFENQTKNYMLSKDTNADEKSANLNNNVHYVNKDYPKTTCNKIDIDQYVSNILIDSLNTMTEQINVINSNNDEDIKLSILEKEIKVKLQSICPSPLIFSNNTISSLLTSIPDKDLLETTVIEEKSRSLAYTTETKIFPIENSTETREKMSASNDNNYQELLEEEFFINNNMAGGTENSASHISLPNMYEDTDIQEMLNNNVESNSFRETNGDFSKEEDFYLLNTSISSDGDKHDSDRDSNSKSVLKQLHKIFENSSRAPVELTSTEMDRNFNFCPEEQSAYFCGSVYLNTSHLEMSTDVDVFVDNSLNKMMNSIDLDYNASHLCADIENMSFNNNEAKSPVNAGKNLVESSDNKKVNETEVCDYELSNINTELNVQKSGNIISNVGTGSQYVKPSQPPLLVPRFSAIPHSQSMEVNTSSDDDVSECESDCISLVDSLDDPSSPRQPLSTHRKVKKRISNYDKKLVRGDIISLLPENSKELNDVKSPKEKGEMFFIPIKEDETDCKENVIVAEHMPEKIKEKLFQRQQKRELRKEHYRRKRMKQLTKEMEKQKDVETKKIKEEHEKECGNILSSLIDQVAHKAKKEEKRKTEKEQKVAQPVVKKAVNAEKKPVIAKKPTSKIDKLAKKEDGLNFESFLVDKQGNIQLKKSRKVPVAKDEPSGEQQSDFTKSTDSELGFESIKNSLQLDLKDAEHIPYEAYKTKNDGYQTPRYDSKLTGPRRLYQKTEFKEGNKHVEILEIVECISSSPETPSDDSQELFPSKRHKRSKIPVLVNEKNNKISKNKSNPKYSKTCRSPINKINPINISMAKAEQKYNKMGNSKMDQLIANILIDAFNEDNPENREVQLVSSPRDRKATEVVIKKLPVPSQIPARRASIPQQQMNNHEKLSVPKYTQRFDAIPEERSSMSVESSNEDINNANINRRSSLPAEIKSERTKKLSPPTNPVRSNENSSSIKIDEIHEKKSPESQSKPDKQNLTSIDENIVPTPSEIITSKENYNPIATSSPKVRSHDTSTSPIPQYKSAATSPSPPAVDDRMNNADENVKQMKGKKALGKRDGWAGFCRPQIGYSSEHEGCDPSSNNPSIREVFEKTESNKKAEKRSPDCEIIAPPSQRILRTMDSRNNIKQISIHHEITTKTEKKAKSVDTFQIINTSHTENIHDRNIQQRSEYTNRHSNEDSTGHTEDTDKTIMSSKITQENNSKSKSHHSKKTSSSSKHHDASADLRYSHKLQNSDSRDSFDKKTLRLPSPFRNQISTQSTESDTSSGTDSEAGLNCPVLVPRWPLNANQRQRRNNINRRPQKQEESFKLPYQNVAGGWSVTLAGSCYTMLPSDVEMKVSFPKSVQQQANSQSDSGLGEERNLQKNIAVSTCKKCGNRENICLNCKTTQNCKCLTTISSKKNSEHGSASFLPPAQIRKVISSPQIESSESTEQSKSSKKYYQYLPDVNAVQGTKNKTKKSLKMARRFSLHCWLPEDKLPGKPKIAKMEISESVVPVNEEELSVMGCAIMPEIKPRVPTMSERDLTRVQTAQFYSRNRHY